MRKIPKNIFQTYPGRKLDPIPKDIINNIYKLKKKNPSWKYYLFRDDDIIDFINKYYGNKILKIYLKINPNYGPARADLFRYLVIYKFGGVYLDIKSGSYIKLDNIIKNYEYVLMYWHHSSPNANIIKNSKGEFQQWNVISVPNHPFLKNIIKRVLWNILNYNIFFNLFTGKQGVLNITGPIVYSIEILKLLDYKPNDKNNILKYKYKIYNSDLDAGLIYNILPNNHIKYFKNTHYSYLNEKIVL